MRDLDRPGDVSTGPAPAALAPASDRAEAIPYFKFLIIVFFMQIETFVYMIVNWVSSRMRQVSLLTRHDIARPVRLRSLWLYLSLLQYCLMMVFEFRSYRQLFRIFVCLGLNSLISYRSFLRFPSAYPRPVLPEIEDDRLANAWRALHKMDRPTNTFPSLHVGHVYLLALLVAEGRPREQTQAHLLWATAIAVSTVTTKQHYLIDVTGGLYLAEQLASEVFEPWNRGKLGFRDVLRGVRRMNAHLDWLAANPIEAPLGIADRHPVVAEFITAYRRHGSFASLFDACDSAFLFERKRMLLEMLRRLRPYVSVMNFVAPGLLQFARDLEDADPHITPRGVHRYLQGLDEDLTAVMGQLFFQEPNEPSRAVGPLAREASQ